MPTFRDVISSASGLLPYLEQTLQKSWGSFQVKRAGGDMQGFRPVSDRTEPWGRMTAARQTTQDVAISFMLTLTKVEDPLEVSLTATDFRSDLDAAIYNWGKTKGVSLLSGDLGEITGTFSAQQRPKTTDWQVIVVRRFELTFLEGC